MATRLVGAGKHAVFLAGRSFSDPQVSREPHLDEETLAALVKALSTCGEYLEFGAGGSTFLALRSGVRRVVTVESDRRFLQAVLRQITDADRDRLLPIFADIGLTGRWGRPLLQLGRDWRVYPRAPWNRLPGFRPDVILIDGRFRVACALEAMLRLPPEWNGRLFIDDYCEREYLWPILQYARDVRRHGRSISFTRGEAERSAIAQDLVKYYADHR